VYIAECWSMWVSLNTLNIHPADTKLWSLKHIIRVYSTGWICMYIYMVRTHLTKRKTTKNSG